MALLRILENICSESTCKLRSNRISLRERGEAALSHNRQKWWGRQVNWPIFWCMFDGWRKTCLWSLHRGCALWSILELFLQFWIVLWLNRWIHLWLIICFFLIILFHWCCELAICYYSLLWLLYFTHMVSFSIIIIYTMRLTKYDCLQLEQPYLEWWIFH